MEAFQKLKEALGGELENDVGRFERGNKSAGTRIRKAMQEVKRAAQEVRKEVLFKKAKEAGPSDAAKKPPQKR